MSRSWKTSAGIQERTLPNGCKACWLIMPLRSKRGSRKSSARIRGLLARKTPVGATNADAMSGEENPKGGEETPLLFATFLESIPPGSLRPIDDLFENRPGPYGDRWYVRSPEIQLHCPSETCGGTRIFQSGDISLSEGGLQNIFTTYFCRN